MRNGAAGKARVFTKHKQVIILALCPTGIGVVNVVLVSIGELLLSDNRSYCVVCSDGVRSKGRRQKKYSSQSWVGLCAVPCNKRYHTLKNYKRSPRYLIGQIAGQLIKKIGTCILLWHSNIVIIYYFLLFYCYFLYS